MLGPSWFGKIAVVGSSLLGTTTAGANPVTAGMNHLNA